MIGRFRSRFASWMIEAFGMICRGWFREIGAAYWYKSTSLYFDSNSYKIHVAHSNSSQTASQTSARYAQFLMFVLRFPFLIPTFCAIRREAHRVRGIFRVRFGSILLVGTQESKRQGQRSQTLCKRNHCLACLRTAASRRGRDPWSRSS